jgi:hypothetical protein
VSPCASAKARVAGAQERPIVGASAPCVIAFPPHLRW